MKVLAIESSCDDTSFAVVNDDKTVDFHETINHRKFHREHGGVVPEMAAPHHLDTMVHLSTFKKKINLANIDAIASTYGPGLIGGLIVGSSFAKGLALSQKKKIVPINHLQAHLLSPRLVSQLSFPYLCLLVSGGNTAIVLVKSAKKFITLGSTIDDSAGECFDKVAKAMGLGYPGGPVIEKLALGGEPSSFILPQPLSKIKDCNFSFSGLKTSAIQIIKKNKLQKKFLRNFSASFQFTVGEIFLNKISNAFTELEKNKIKIKDFSVCGGVAANQYINGLLKNFIEDKGIAYHQVPMAYCTDNAAMIGWNAIEILKSSKNKFNNYNVRPSPNTLIHENF